MGYPEFYSNRFVPESDAQQRLVEDIRRLRNIFGMPHRLMYLRSLVKTRKYVRTVYPPDWKFR